MNVCKFYGQNKKFYFKNKSFDEIIYLHIKIYKKLFKSKKEIQEKEKTDKLLECRVN